MRSQEFTGKTTQEAIDAGLAALGVTIADVHVDVIQEGAKGLFGLFGSKPACVRLTVMEDEKEEEESQLTKRQQKKAKKLEAKEAKKAEKTAKKEAKKSRKKGIEPTEGEFETVDEIEEPIIETVEEASEQKPSEINEQSLIEETSNSFAADIKEMMGDTSEEMEEVIENEISEEVTLEEEIQEEKIQEEKEPVEEKKLAIPVYTKEELLAKAEKAGEVPVVRKDEYSGITIIDYSDIL